MGILIGLCYTITTEFKNYKRKRFIQLRKEQEYPIAFIDEKCTYKIKTRTRFSASMINNTFTNINTGEKINTDEYCGFVIFGNTMRLNLFHGDHGDLIFVKKRYSNKDLIRNIVVYQKNNNYLIGKVNSIKKDKVTLDTKEVIDLLTIIGPVDFDFNII